MQFSKAQVIKCSWKKPTGCVLQLTQGTIIDHQNNIPSFTKRGVSSGAIFSATTLRERRKY